MQKSLMEIDDVRYFSNRALDLFLEQQVLLLEKVNLPEQSQPESLAFRLKEASRKLYECLSEENPHVNMVIAHGGDFVRGKEVFTCRYLTFLKYKKWFETPGVRISYVPVNFAGYKEVMEFTHRHSHISDL